MLTVTWPMPLSWPVAKMASALGIAMPFVEILDAFFKVLELHR